VKLSVPIYRLKRQARLLSRKLNIPLHEALDRAARAEGFPNWSSLAAHAEKSAVPSTIFSKLEPGDLVLLAARPGHGKTLMALELIVVAIGQGHQGAFFTLENTPGEVSLLLQSLGTDLNEIGQKLSIDTSSAISADYIIDKLQGAKRGTLAVVDYLQVLDQDRRKPELLSQVRSLKAFAEKAGVILVFISQIDRSFDGRTKLVPSLDDVRLPNPLNLGLFSKTCFLNDGHVQFDAVM
jgi:replicative DNA helicase